MSQEPASTAFRPEILAESNSKHQRSESVRSLTIDDHQVRSAYIDISFRSNSVGRKVYLVFQFGGWSLYTKMEVELLL